MCPKRKTWKKKKEFETAKHKQKNTIKNGMTNEANKLDKKNKNKHSTTIRLHKNQTKTDSCRPLAPILSSQVQHRGESGVLYVITCVCVCMYVCMCVFSPHISNLPSNAQFNLARGIGKRLWHFGLFAALVVESHNFGSSFSSNKSFVFGNNLICGSGKKKKGVNSRLSR